MYNFLQVPLVMIVLAMLLSQPAHAACDNTIYVNTNAQESQNDGSSWANAYTDLQSALDEAKGCGTIQTIWVAEGTYKPTVDVSGGTTSGTQNLVYNIDFDVKLYGGFCGWEKELYERTKHLCPTVLSGDHDSDDVYTKDINSPDFPFINGQDNSYNIMRMKNLSSQAIIDGFTFMGGDADHPSLLSKRIGGAIFNDGRGLNSESIPNIQNCTFQYNKSIEGGGAIYNYGLGGDASPSIKVCEFKFNKSSSDGGAVYHLGERIVSRKNTIFNSCLFVYNKAISSGGAIYGMDLSPQSGYDQIVTQSTIANNQAGAGAGIFLSFQASSPILEIKIKGTIFNSNATTTFGNAVSFGGDNVNITASYSLFPEASGTDPNFNINLNPQFINASSNYRLAATSPAINTGAEAPSPFEGSRLPNDIDGNARRLGSRKDIGAYEFLACPANSKIHVALSSDIRATGEQAHLALTSLNMALKMACNCADSPEIHLEEGIYIPHRLADLSIADDRTKHTFFIECPVSIIGHGDVVLSGDILQSNKPYAIPIDSIRSNNCDILLSAVNITHISIDSIEIQNANQAGLKINNYSPSIDTTVLSVKNTLFRNNYYDCISLQSSSDAQVNIEVVKCDFSRNYILGSRQSDGCIEISTAGKATGLIEDCIFRDNQLGGIYLLTSDSSRTIINRCVFDENLSYIGAGIEIRDRANETSFYEISNCVFKDNKGQSSGAAIYAEKSSDTYVDIRNCTFFNNYTDTRSAGAVNFFNQNGSASIKYSIFWKNTNQLGERSFNGDVDVSYSLIGEESCPVFIQSRCNEAMLYNVDPLFVQEFGTFGSNLNLQSSSPAINKGRRGGSDPAFSFDIINNIRYVGRVDLGAFEYQTSDCPTSIVNPIIPSGQENSVSLQADMFIELSDDYNTSSGGVLFLDANNVIIEPTLSIEKGAIVEIDVYGCNN